MIEILIHLRQVLFAAINAVSQSASNIILFFLLSNIFTKWLGLPLVISFFCSTFCISKIVNYLKCLWLKNRMKHKTRDETLSLNELSWESPQTLSIKTNNENDKFEIDWKYLLNDDTKNMFSSIVNIPFNNGLLVFAMIIITEYQMNTLNYNYIISLIRTIGFFIILISGSSIRYQTLFQRDQNKFFDLIIKNREEIERYIIYSNNNIPIVSVGLQILNLSGSSVFMVQLYQVNSKFNDYFYDLANVTCQNLIERLKIYGNEKKQSVHLIWLLPTCKKNWMFAIKANKLILRNSYKDFSFMPLVNSYVEQYEYVYEYKDLSSNILDDQ